MLCTAFVGMRPQTRIPQRLPSVATVPYRVAQFASTSRFVPPPADIDDEEENEASEDDADAEVEAPEEEADAPPEQAPGVPVVPKAAPEPPIV
jgi:hypothetical protein